MEDRLGQFLYSWVAYLLISLTLIGLDSLSWLKFVKTPIDSIANPISQTLSTIINGALEPLSAIKFSFTGSRRIADLERRLAEATSQNFDNQILRSENESLKKLLGSNIPDDITAIPVRAIKSGHQIILAAGSNQGLDRDLTVVSPDYSLVGSINRLSTTTSWVQTLTSPDLRIPVVTSLKNTPGILVSKSGQAIVENIQQDDAIDIGDQVITSGVNGLFVPGILVGTVVEINASPADLYKTARLEILDSEFTGTLFVLGL